ncbi:proteasome subunit alpha 6 (T01 family), partial [Schistosoma mansoni]|uniref:proteasome subunit alpha 6 (T01 family) n=1 Tax=Schistosoma mansoni TaxID=6183 RepID=UPI00022DC7EF
IKSQYSNKTEYDILNYYLFLVSFKNIIGTTSLSDVTGVRWLTDLSGSLQKKKACNSRGFTIWSTTQAKKYGWKVRCSTFYCVCDQQVSDWVEFLNSSVLKTRVICVGGDGFLTEAVQGLLLHERLKFNLPLFSGHKPGEIELKPTIRLGVIPAGSTDAVSYSVHGTNDVVTAALHIISGDDISLDVVTVHADDDGTFIRYVLTMLGYGFHSDLLRNDDKRRWMGPQRYNYSGLKTLLQHASYHGEISFLPCSDPNNLSSNGIVCNSGFFLCRISFLNTNVNLINSLKTILFILSLDKNSERNSFDVNSCNIMSNKREKISNIGIEQLHDNQLAPSRSSLKPIKNWHTIRGTFLAINAFVQSCRCSRAVCGPAPWAHLGDGCLDLVLVHKCSKVQFIRYLMSIAQNRHMTPEENPFNFPFISVMKVCAFRFVAQNQSKLKKFDKLDTNCLCNKQHNLQITHNVSINDDSTIESLSTTFLSEPNSSNPTISRKKTTIWCSDGELIQKSSIICFVHRKLIRFFGRGPEQHSDSNGSLDTSVEKQESCRLILQSMMDEIYSIY